MEAKSVTDNKVNQSPLRLCVFCGSSPGANPAYRSAAETLGHELAGRGWGLVYGGGKVGIMGAVADATLAADGEVVGVIPQALMQKELGHTGITKLEVVSSMHERKKRMADLADGFVALPGGLGTLEEIFETLTWAQLGIHSKPCAFLNVEGYYDPLLEFLDRSVGERFVRAAHREMVLVENSPAALLDRIEAYDAPRIEKWMDREET
jgi:uncharacterized protein (TIGR00730 family)